MKYKYCRICIERKSLDAFTKNKTNDDGHSHMCKECCSAYRKMLRGTHKKEKLIEKTEMIEIKEGNFIVSFD